MGCKFIYGQKVAFEEYDLDNGLHVILHEDNSVPIVTTSVLYHVGSKDENPERTGFAHFFEHLLFEGTNPLGQSNAGGTLSAENEIGAAEKVQHVLAEVHGERSRVQWRSSSCRPTRN